MAMTEAQKKAQGRYDAKRKGQVVTFRLTDGEIGRLDSVRHEATRGQYAKAALLKALGVDP